ARPSRVGREELGAVDDPLVSVALRTGHEHAGIGAALGLRHREARHDVALQQWLEVTLSLFRCAVVGDDLRVAGVRRLRAEDARTPDRLAEDLVQQCQLQLAVSLPAEFGAEVAGPQTLVTYGLLHRG